ncbi:MAG: hypothetical protein QW412_02110 [Candidatus Aenigmatarchaeota archaeon]
MKKLALLFFFFFFSLFFVKECLAGVGIGMGPTKFNLVSSINKPYLISLIFYNPGNYDVKAKLTFECENCEEKVYFFGWYLGRIKEDYTQFFSFDSEEVYIPNNTIPEKPVSNLIKVHPNIWVKKEFIISTPEEINFLVRTINPEYPGEFSIPYYTLLLDEKKIKGGITATVVWSTFGEMGAAPAVGAEFNLSIKGMPTGSLILIILAVLIIVIGVFWKSGIYKRIFKKSLPPS